MLPLCDIIIKFFQKEERPDVPAKDHIHSKWFPTCGGPRNNKRACKASKSQWQHCSNWNYIWRNKWEGMPTLQDFFGFQWGILYANRGRWCTCICRSCKEEQKEAKSSRGYHWRISEKGTGNCSNSWDLALCTTNKATAIRKWDIYLYIYIYIYIYSEMFLINLLHQSKLTYLPSELLPVVNATVNSIPIVFVIENII